MSATEQEHRRVHRRVRRWLVRLLGLVLLYAACVAGGTAATTLFPTTVDTLNYRATLRLSVAPGQTSAIWSPTVFGDIHLNFATPVPAPGVLATVQVKERITDVLSRPGVSVRSLQPGPLELEEATREAAVGLAWRFAAGAGVVALLGVGGYVVWSRRRPRPLRVAAAGGAWLLACAVTFGSVAFGYRPERFESFTTTGILGAVQRNADLLAGVETRAEQTTPYLKNLLALSAALQEGYSPQELNRPVAARILLVSDIHGANQYPLMKAVVEQERIDAVVDAGDIVNFGNAQEAQAAGVFSGIASLGVPYLFVKGNHDASAAQDTGLLQALDRVPNVVLLEPDTSGYTVQSVNGIRIAGFNDPRWFGDDNKDNAAKQKGPAARFVEAMADRPPPDLVVSHEPGAVSAVERADVKVHGHLHSKRLDGNTIGVGTFTGGGPLSHFLEGGEGEELTGQPSSFDVAVFGTDCRLTSLTRYQYRNVIEGTPAYDDVTLINGSRIEPPSDEDGGAEVVGGEVVEGEPAPEGQTAPRSCDPASGLGVEQVPATPR